MPLVCDHLGDQIVVRCDACGTREYFDVRANDPEGVKEVRRRLLKLDWQVIQDADARWYEGKMTYFCSSCRD